ncbi:MAG: 3-phosphoshikimate 1-carboxyvinyltransferase, partial [Methanomicrobium sp.]|nr:3-phosphoshikimate 1-carboxyvinyltransferase [Methanomicrobium sp.]
MDISIKKTGDVSAEFTAPPSKSYTHRALIAAALADGTSFIRNPLISDDIKVTIDALRKLGVSIEQKDDFIRSEER